MPEQGVQWKPHESMLSFEEILRICRIMAVLGIRKIKVTGGEPLVRRGVASFLNNLKTISGIEKVTLTTNGLLLGAYLDEAGSIALDSPLITSTELRSSEGSPLDAVNISLDTLDPQRYKRITRHDGDPAKILSFADRLLEKHIPVKINCVPVRSFNEEDILPLTALAGEKNIIVRFIELMPLGSAAALKPIPGPEIAQMIEKAYGALSLFTGIQGNGPAVYYSLSGFTGKIGFINAVSRGFCETCNRLRLTSEGFLKLCLSTDLGIDLRELLRAGACDGELERAITEAVANKPRFHSLSGVYGAAPVEGQHPAGMSGIGG